jgi:ParB family transcriptional regulator, chromosome partitioning protein
MTRMMKTTDIEVNGRHRQDLGDLDDLAASIADVGLLQPLVVNGKGKLVAGVRRLEAVRKSVVHQCGQTQSD